jgi:hypothetical protein
MWLVGFIVGQAQLGLEPNSCFLFPALPAAGVLSFFRFDFLENQASAKLK